MIENPNILCQEIIDIQGSIPDEVNFNDDILACLTYLNSPFLQKHQEIDVTKDFVLELQKYNFDFPSPSLLKQYRKLLIKYPRFTGWISLLCYLSWCISARDNFNAKELKILFKMFSGHAQTTSIYQFPKLFYLLLSASYQLFLIFIEKSESSHFKHIFMPYGSLISYYVKTYPDAPNQFLSVISKSILHLLDIF